MTARFVLVVMVVVVVVVGMVVAGAALRFPPLIPRLPNSKGEEVGEGEEIIHP